MSSFVPPYIFSKEWREGNFSIPAEPTSRAEKRQQFYYYLHYAVMWRPENRQTRTVLEARFAAIEEHDKVLSTAKSAAWANANKADPDALRRNHLDLSTVSFSSRGK